MTKYTEFGRAVKKALVDRGMTGVWLVEQVRVRTGMYFDPPYLSRLIRGQKHSAVFEAAIREVLELESV
jgi:hypothetical protein